MSNMNMVGGWINVIPCVFRRLYNTSIMMPASSGFTTKITGNLEYGGKKYDSLTKGEAAVSRDRNREEQVGSLV